VQPTSNSKRDKGLSEARAKAVHDWLTDWGIDPLRMQAAGFGGTKPLVPANSRGAAEINNRLELIILERK
jgi:flagellar motor protein MotB